MKDASRRAAPLLIAALCALAPGCGRQPSGQSLSVAAAADLQFALGPIVRDFHAAHPGVAVNVDYGSSGNFFAQIQNRAPFDVFLSADTGYPRKLAAEGIGAGGSIFIYALGRIVVWVPAASLLDPAAALESPALRHVAIANPQHAPYGQAAQAALRAMGLYDQLSAKLVLGENVAQTLEFVQTGAAECGIVALSLALAPAVRRQGRYWEIPADRYPKIAQAGLLLNNSPAAAAFRDWLLSPAAARLWRDYGFRLPS